LAKGNVGKWTLEITLYADRDKAVFHGHHTNKYEAAYYRMYYIYATGKQIKLFPGMLLCHQLIFFHAEGQANLKDHSPNSLLAECRRYC